MQPGKEALDESAALIPSVVAVILGLEYAGEPMRRNEIHAVLFEIVIEAIAVNGQFRAKLHFTRRGCDDQLTDLPTSSECVWPDVR